MEENSNKNTIKATIADLKSRNERKIIGALNRIPHEGSPEMIEPLFALLLQNPGEEMRILLDKILFNLKDPACVTPIMDVLQNQTYKTIQPYVLSAIWQSGLDVEPHVNTLVEIAISGDFLTSVEVVTIIESTEFTEDAGLTKAIQRLDKVVEQKDEKQALLLNLRELLLEKLLGEQ